MDLPWLRWWDAEGNLLLTGEERAEKATERAEKAEEKIKDMEELLNRYQNQFGDLA